MNDGARLGVAAGQIAEAVYPVFAAHGWTYGRGDGHAPTRGELAVTIASLLDRMASAEVDGSTRTGRFAAYRETDASTGEAEVRIYLDLTELVENPDADG